MKNPPTSDHEYFHSLVFVLTQLMEAKFMAGVEEHRSHIWDMTEEQLEMAELEELIDLIHYRLTKIMKRKGLI